MSASFERIGPARLSLPVILSVPHAGRCYPDQIEKDSRFSSTHLRVLEDRYADLLVQDAQSCGFVGLVARTPRAWIDLNRAEHDIDPAMLSAPIGPPAHLSAKARGGLGLIPRRTNNLGDIWQRRLTPDEVRVRIADHYRPYHKALADLLDETRERFGGAILLDIHSMPPLPSTREGLASQIVIGDRFGRSSGCEFARQAGLCAQEAGFRTAFNMPYAGGHILDHHAKPDRNTHGLQIEVDRSLYLDEQLAEPGPNLPAIARLISDIAQRLADTFIATAMPLAAE